MRSKLVPHLCLAALLIGLGAPAYAESVCLRFRVIKPDTGESLRIRLGGWRHSGPVWTLPNKSVSAEPGKWSDWVDLSDWPLHKRMSRAGGLAEWPSVKMTVGRAGSRSTIDGCAFDVQIAEAADEKSVVISFSEASESDSIAFLLPHPLREHMSEFETGSQMTARQLGWAREIAGKEPIALKQFDVCTTLWGHYDAGLASQNVETLRLLGFNVVNGAPDDVLRKGGVHVLGKTWDYVVDPDEAVRRWTRFRQGKLASRMVTEEGKWQYENMRHLVISDEVKVLSFKSVEAAKRDGWFRDYLRKQGVTQEDVGRPLDEVEFPFAELTGKVLPRDADLQKRKLLYHGAKFGQWWSAKQLRQTSDLIREAIPGMKSEALPASHGFFNAWGPPSVGMSAALLDFFELGRQQSVDVLSAEDWLGLNHMYGPAYTWTGAQSFEYLCAVMRSAIGQRPMKLLGLITPSDDAYLRLKAYSCLAQGGRAFYFWTFGPTFIGSENYWSDLRSEYEGISKTTRAISKVEDVIAEARPVSDPVAILYSVSQEIWNPDRPAAFVEKRLLWHALRHLNVQPDFVSEEDVAAGRLKDYRVLFVVDWCVSRKASNAIDAWVKDGGIACISAGAATRDEFHEPHAPAFASAVWAEGAAENMLLEEGNKFNERTDLPEAKSMGRASVRIGGEPLDLPALGCRVQLRAGSSNVIATFEDGSAGGVEIASGKGKVIGLGFMPMLAYGQMAGFKPKTLEEKWPAGPRQIVQYVLEAAKVSPQVTCDVPVVEATLLKGKDASVLVLANYTYKPLTSVTIGLPAGVRVGRATSTEGVAVRIERSGDRARLTLPLQWTDLVRIDAD